MASLLLSFQDGKLVVTGSTFGVKDTLKSFGGRWYPELKGWALPSNSKRRLLAELRACRGVAKIEDVAKVTLVLEDCDKGHLVQGDTYPVRDFLKENGGWWDAQLAGWVFPATLEAERLDSMLVASGQVERVQRAQKAPAAIGSDVLPPAAYETPDRRRGGIGGGTAGAAGAGGSTGKKSAEKRGALVAGKAGSGLKVVGVGKTQRSVQTGADGSLTETQKQEQRVAAKRSKAHVETRSVTNKRKVMEIKDKIVETASVTVRLLKHRRVQWWPGPGQVPCVVALPRPRVKRVRSKRAPV